MWNPSDFTMDFMIYFIKSNRISHNIMKSNTILLKAIGFHENREFKVFHEIQQDFTKTNEISQDFLKSTGFNTIS